MGIKERRMMIMCDALFVVCSHWWVWFADRSFQVQVH